MKEQLAALEHDRWSRWMKYLFAKGTFNEDGSFSLSKEYVVNLRKQIETSYDQLSEAEKDSDRKEADNTIELLLSESETIEGVRYLRL